MSVRSDIGGRCTRSLLRTADFLILLLAGFSEEISDNLQECKIQFLDCKLNRWKKNL